MYTHSCAVLSSQEVAAFIPKFKQRFFSRLSSIFLSLKKICNLFYRMWQEALQYMLDVSCNISQLCSFHHSDYPLDNSVQINTAHFPVSSNTNQDVSFTLLNINTYHLILKRLHSSFPHPLSDL